MALLDPILPLIASHLDVCAELFVLVFNQKPWHEQWTLETAHQRLWETLRTPGFVGFVYEDKEVLGFVAGYCEQLDVGKGYCLKELCVHSAKQRTGIGTYLLNHLHSHLTQQDVRRIYLVTTKVVQVQAFYTKLGYQQSQKRMLMLHQL